MPEIRLLGSNSEGGERKQVVPNAKIDELRREKEENNAIFQAAAGAAQLTAGLVKESKARKDKIDIAAAEGEYRALEKEVQSNHFRRMEEEQTRFFEDDDGFSRDVELDYQTGLDSIKKGKSAAAQARIDELAAGRAPVYLQDRFTESVAARERFDTDRSIGLVSTLLTDAAADGDLNAALAAVETGKGMDLGERGNEEMANLTNTALSSMISAQLANPATTMDTAEAVLTGDLGGLDPALQIRLQNQARSATRAMWSSPNGPYSDASIGLAVQNVGENPHALNDMVEDAEGDLEFSRSFLSPLELANAEGSIEKARVAKQTQDRAFDVQAQLAEGTVQGRLSPFDPTHVMGASLHFNDGLSQFPDMQPGAIANFVGQAAASGVVPPELPAYVASLDYATPRGREIVNGLVTLGVPGLTNIIQDVVSKSKPVADTLEEAQAVLLGSGRAAEAASLSDIPTARRLTWEREVERFAGERMKSLTNSGINTKDHFAVASAIAHRKLRRRFADLDLGSPSDRELDAWAQQTAAASINLWVQNPNMEMDQVMELAATEVLGNMNKTQFSSRGYGFNAPDSPSTLPNGDAGPPLYPQAMDHLLAETRGGVLRNLEGKITADTIENFEVVSLDPNTGQPNGWQFTLIGEDGGPVPVNDDNGLPYTLFADPSRLDELRLSTPVDVGEEKPYVGEYMRDRAATMRRLDAFDPDDALTIEATQKLEDPAFIATHAAAPTAARTFGALAVELDDPELIKLAAKVQDNANTFSREDTAAALSAMFTARADIQDRREELKQLPIDRAEEVGAEMRELDAREKSINVARAQLVSAKIYLTAMESAGVGVLDPNNPVTANQSKQLKAAELFIQDRHEQGIDISGLSPEEFREEMLKWARAGGLVSQMTKLGPFNVSNETLQSFNNPQGL